MRWKLAFGLRSSEVACWICLKLLYIGVSIVVCIVLGSIAILFVVPLRDLRDFRKAPLPVLQMD